MHRLLAPSGSTTRAVLRLSKANAPRSIKAPCRSIGGSSRAVPRGGLNRFNRALVVRRKHTGKDTHHRRRPHEVSHKSKSPAEGNRSSATANGSNNATAASEATASEATASEATVLEAAVEEGASSAELPPTAQQLLMFALRSAVPMIGFGFMDNTIMIHAGHYVDCTLGVTFGLSTLAAAGIGQIFSGIGGVMFGDALDVAFKRISGSTKMTSAQRAMKAARMAKMTGGVVGVTIGCALGLINLLFVDQQKVSLLKLQALEEGQEFEFEVEVDNEMHPGYTTVIVHGPDVDGVLASITASIASIGCSVVELHASPRNKDAEESDGASSSTDSDDSSSFLDHLVPSQTQKMEDVFLIRDRSTHQAIDNEDLDDLARTVLAAAKDPLNSHSLKAQVDELHVENIALADRVSILERMLEDRQIKIRERAPIVPVESDEEESEEES